MFKFGKNWKSFLNVVDEERIFVAENSLREKLGRQDLRNLSFLDVGCGSGLFSLAAIRLGAKRVFSFDYDVDSVECCVELKRRFFPDSSHWEIRQGSALDSSFISSLGNWDIVYSWGVLHHTGNMQQAIGNVIQLVAPSGTLFISIYNDQGFKSRAWTAVKRAYNANFVFRTAVICMFIPYFLLQGVLVSLLKFQNPFTIFTQYQRNRGMSRFHDWIDWLGGYPFEVAKPERIFDFYRARGFALERLKTCAGGLGCNEFVFIKLTERSGDSNLSEEHGSLKERGH
jgi:2-polyprenyl-6-hydroxyphenyl methylase/3-demethylubiquinone-9 3-methyltransferase